MLNQRLVGDRPAERAPLLLSASLLLATAVLALSLSSPALADFESSVSLKGQSLRVENLIGEITVVGYDGTDFQIDAAVQGKDATPENLRIESEDGTEAILRVLYPKGEDEFVYPRLGSHSRTTFSFSDRDEKDGWLSALLGGLAGDRISVRGGGRGTEAWADLTIKVPRGKSIQVKLGVGEINASKIDGDVSLDTHSGAIAGSGIHGSVVLDSGSGRVTARDIQGDLVVDTGSGNVAVENVRGKSVGIDTGSGSVTASDIECENFVIDTGAGSIESIGCATNAANFDTGSGSIDVAFTRMGSGTFVFDTGSGGVDVLLPDEVSVEVKAETSSGGIQVDVHRPRDVEKEDSSVRFTLGAGDAKLRIDSGSGTIRIAQAS